MNITLNEDQRLIAETALSYAKTALTPEQIRKLEETDNGFDPATWQQMVKMG